MTEDGHSEAGVEWRNAIEEDVAVDGLKGDANTFYKYRILWSLHTDGLLKLSRKIIVEVYINLPVLAVSFPCLPRFRNVDG